MKESDHCNVSPEQGCRYADQAADRAVTKTFAILGVDIDKPESVSSFQADLRFGKHVRQNTGRGIAAACVIVVSGIMAALWVGITTKLGSG